jgi:hypothetical protein
MRPVSLARLTPALFALALAPRLAAQDACGDIAKLFGQAPAIGRWSELRMEKKSGGRPPTVMRMAVVGSEKQAGKTLYRMQMSSTDPRSGQRMIVQMLTPWGLDALGGRGQREVVMKMGDQPAVKMVPPKGAAGQDAAGFREQCAKYKFVGEESVTVPAGTYRARRYSGPDGDTWVAPEVPGWHLVKMTGKDGSTMTLTAVGDGAKNDITETPVDFKSMMNNPEALRRMTEAQGRGQPDSAGH